jgi:hypothetical protein
MESVCHGETIADCGLRIALNTKRAKGSGLLPEALRMILQAIRIPQSTIRV